MTTLPSLRFSLLNPKTEASPESAHGFRVHHLAASYANTLFDFGITSSHSDFGVEKGIKLEGLSEAQISKALEDLRRCSSSSGFGSSPSPSRRGPSWSRRVLRPSLSSGFESSPSPSRRGPLIFWAFSIYLEAVAILPQLVLLQRSGNVDNLTGAFKVSFLSGSARLYGKNINISVWKKNRLCIEQKKESSCRLCELRSSDRQGHHRSRHSSQRIGEAALMSSETDTDFQKATRRTKSRLQSK
ncbi:hypothetical protein AHAS_Ahas09G0050700 [Arachis hypogaea]